MAESAEAKKSFFDAESYDNNPDIEKAWAGNVVDHMEVHFNLITAVNPKTLRLSPHDDILYSAFKEEFPNFKLDVLDEESLKSKENKEKWNRFCMKFKEIVNDATFGTLVRIDCREGYTENNTIFVVRVQFLVIEIARNRDGLNNFIFEKHQK